MRINNSVDEVTELWPLPRICRPARSHYLPPADDNITCLNISITYDYNDTFLARDEQNEFPVQPFPNAAHYSRVFRCTPYVSGKL